MKTLVLAALSMVLSLVIATSLQAAQPPARTNAYISDTVDIPLRAGASDRYKIVGAVRNGAAVSVLQVDATRGFTQIRAPSGARGWVRTDLLTDTPSSKEQLVGVRQELAQLQSRHSDLKQHMDEAANTPTGEALSYPELYEETLRLRQQLAEYRKVATETVAIDDRNKVLQERTVTLERELQITQQENRALRNDNGNMRLLMGAILLGACLLVATLMPRVMEQRRAQWSRL